MELIQDRYGRIKMQCAAKQLVIRPVNLYITEYWVVFVEHETIDTPFSARQPQTRDPKSAQVWNKGSTYAL